MLLENKVALITGSGRGIGRAMAKLFAKEGAAIFLTARTEKELEAVAEEIAADGGKAGFATADLTKVADCGRVFAAAEKQFGRLDILVNNAGVAGPIGSVESTDWQEWIRTIEINLLGSVLLSRAVLPHFKRAHSGKIIQLSGGGATNPLPMLSAYAASKAAIIRFMETLAEETRAHNIDVNAVAPGTLDTRILDEFLAAGPDNIGSAFHARALKHKQDGGVPLCKGAELCVFLASRLSDGITGKLISAAWDPWKRLPEHLDDLNATDVYTLRRVVPKDRGLDWGADE